MTVIRSRAVVALLALVVAACGRGGGEAGGHAEETHAGEGGHAEHGGEEAGADGSVELSREQVIAAGIQIGRLNPSEAGAYVTATGEIQADPDRTVTLGSSVAGRVTMARGAVGDRVRVGQALATIEAVERPAASAEIRSAEARAALARENVTREMSLFERGLAPRRDLLEAESELRQAEAELEAARLRSSALASTVATPIAGVIAERRVGIGQVVSPGDALFVVVAPEKLQAEINVYEHDVPRIRVGAAVTITASSIADREFRGRVAGVSPVIDEVTRAAKIRAVLDNPDELLRPGLFVTAAIAADGSPCDSTRVLLIPERAVCRLGDRRVVFTAVMEDDGGVRFTPRDVTVGFRAADRIAVLEGLTPENLVVLEGAFSVLSALRKGELGEGHAH